MGRTVRPSPVSTLTSVLSPDQLLERPEEFKQLLDGLAQLKSDSMHFAFMGAAQTDTFLELIVLQFLQKGA